MILIQSIKAVGIAVGALLFAYAFAIAKLARYEPVDDKYASAFSTVGLLLILVASGGFTRPPINFGLELTGYVVAAIGGTAAFVRIANNQQRYKRA